MGIWVWNPTQIKSVSKFQYACVEMTNEGRLLTESKPQSGWQQFLFKEISVS